MDKIIQYGNGVRKLSYQDRIILKNLIAAIQYKKEMNERRIETRERTYWENHPLVGGKNRS